MTYRPIRQPKLSDAIEQALERLILEGTLAAGEQLPPERELAKQFGVSRPSVREAIQRLEAKKLLLRRQGGGTFVSEAIGQDFSDSLLQLLSQHPDTQFDIIEARYALEGLASYFAALRGNDADFQRIKDCHHTISEAQQRGDLQQEASAVTQYLVAVAEAAHNLVLLHIVRSLSGLLANNIIQNLELLYRHQGTMEKIRRHRADIVAAILSRQPTAARDAAQLHLTYIEETMLESTKEEGRLERSLRRSQQRMASSD
ncbi:pyruvate dehydrogenase complex transcriptional repressor PdhR [Thaumasiovibrio sp. DFM-14]|uniref:pyruvate dehydrogenase complex transcriptional repressor PdhR n=1 Tax=Thaumasiovibrio sp. DFM-14 TaxID=3384792 RepID=UPI00399FF032